VPERGPTPDIRVEDDEEAGVSVTGDLPTSAGGTSGVEPQAPGQSLGQVPEHNDDDRDEAGDRDAAGPGTHRDQRGAPRPA